MQPYWATPIGYFWSTWDSKPHLVPIPIETGRTRVINVADLNIDAWVLLETVYEGCEDDLPMETYRTRIITSPVLETRGSFAVAYFKQGPMAGPFNKVARRLGSGVARAWRGNVMVVKLNEKGYVEDMSERDLGLAEHLVLS